MTEHSLVKLIGATEGVAHGTVGTIVHVYQPATSAALAYEVEFVLSDDESTVLTLEAHRIRPHLRDGTLGIIGNAVSEHLKDYQALHYRYEELDRRYAKLEQAHNQLKASYELLRGSGQPLRAAQSAVEPKPAINSDPWAQLHSIEEVTLTGDRLFEALSTQALQLKELMSGRLWTVMSYETTQGEPTRSILTVSSARPVQGMHHLREPESIQLRTHDMKVGNELIQLHEHHGGARVFRLWSPTKQEVVPLTCLKNK